VENFAGQWLQLRNLAIVQPDKKLFPAFDAKLRAAMQRETELLFENILREDRSVFDFLTADYTFVNERLAKHYGLAGVTGEEFQRVSLKGTPRAGVLTHASILTLTSNPTRTSPVKRGKWVLENLLATPPPPPAPNVPELDDQKQLTGTLRQRKGTPVQCRVWSTLRTRRRARRTRHASRNPAAPPPRVRRSRPAPPTLQLPRLGARSRSLPCSARLAATICLACQVRNCTALLQRAR
jgi:hypothetical protein